MKRSLLLAQTICCVFTLFLALTALKAQNYTLTATQGSFAPIPSGASGLTTIVINGDEEMSGIATTGFDFNYFGNNYNSYKVTTNGILNFNTSSSDPRPTNLIENTADPIIAPLWDDLSTSASSGSVLAVTEGGFGSSGL